MQIELNDVEIRVLGCLIEKQKTTPEYYPLTLNALTNACNQKSSRNPVVNFDEKTVAGTLENLRDKKLVLLVSEQGSRVAKYRHYLKEKLNLSDQELALMCVLMLRGPQTPGELRTRTERMQEFDDLEDVLLVLKDLSESNSPYVKELPRQAGRKENRYVQLLAGEPDIEELEMPEDKAVLEVRADNEKIALLEKRIQDLEDKLVDLFKTFEQFKSQFD